MKKFAKNVRDYGFGVALAGAGTNALAAVDTSAAVTAIQGAETSAHTVGDAVIAVVAGLVVVGLVIGLVKKL